MVLTHHAWPVTLPRCPPPPRLTLPPAQVVARNFWGSLKPPFNDEARARAGFESKWYLPLVEKTGRRRAEADAADAVAAVAAAAAGAGAGG